MEFPGGKNSSKEPEEQASEEPPPTLRRETPKKHFPIGPLIACLLLIMVGQCDGFWSVNPGSQQCWEHSAARGRRVIVVPGGGTRR